MTTQDQIRERFERWFSEGARDTRAIERRGDVYVLMQAQAAWFAWQAAYESMTEKDTLA